MSAPAEVIRPRVLIIGAGPAGLSAASALAPRVDGEVLVLDRESAAGGIPRHSDHIGYGMRDLHRLMKGPAYASRLTDAALRSGAIVRTGATVTGWADDRSVDVTTPQGRLRVEAAAVVLATGARERPRSARLVPGDRPPGIFTTGHLQNLVYLHHGAIGERAVVAGAELVSWSAVATLRHAGCRTVLMTTQHPSPESYAVFNVGGRAVLRVPVATRTRITRVIGRDRLQAVEIENMATGERRTVECDTLVFTGDWIPDNELARMAGLDIDAGTLGPLVDTTLHTSRAGVFAVGNLVHAVDTADVAALDGTHVAGHVRSWLRGEPPVRGTVRVVADAPFRWVAPGLMRPGGPDPARRRLLLWTDGLVRVPRVVVRQDGREVGRVVVPWPASPGRVFRVPWRVMRRVDPNRGDVHVGLR